VLWHKCTVCALAQAPPHTVFALAQAQKKLNPNLTLNPNLKATVGHAGPCTP